MVKKLLTVTIIITLFGAVSSISAQADDLAAFSQSWTLHELAASESIPVKNLAMELGVVLAEVREHSLSELDITRQDAGDAVTRYREGEPTMVSSIVMVGMMIVFVSLVVVAFLISLFKHLHLFKKTRYAKTSVGTVRSQGDMSERSIAAVVAAIYLHEEEVDSENRLLLTWKRAATNIWKTGSVKPNESHFASRRSR